jgi:quinol monooxygenase YgiN
MFVLLVELETDRDRSNELEMVLRSLVASAASEPGILFYAVQRPQDHSNRFILYEYYEDKAAWETHLQHDLVREKLKRFDDLLKAPPGLTFCDAISTTPVV